MSRACCTVGARLGERAFLDGPEAVKHVRSPVCRNFERIPPVGELDQHGWEKWCILRDIDPLTDGQIGWWCDQHGTDQPDCSPAACEGYRRIMSRRGWCSQLSTYLRQARWLVFGSTGQLKDLCMCEEPGNEVCGEC